MIAVVTILLAFPVGFFVRSSLAANVTYAVAYLWAFSFQGAYLTRGWVGGDYSAFPKDPDTFPFGYGLVSAAIFAAGFGLVSVGHRAARRRRAHRSSAESSQHVYR